MKITPIETKSVFAGGGPKITPLGQEKSVFLVPKIPLRDWEKDFAEDHPKTYKAGKIFTSLFPFTQYLWPSERDRFEAMSPYEKAGAIAFDSVFAALMTPMGRAAIAAPFKAVGTFAKGTTKAARAHRMKPFEDLLLADTKDFVWENAAKKTLRKEFKFTKQEAQAIIDRKLPEYIVQRATPGKKVAPLGKGMKENVKWVNHRPEVTRKVRDSIDFDVLRTKHYQKEYSRMVQQESAVKFGPQQIDEIFRAHNEKVYGKFAPNVTLSEATLPHVGNLIENMVRHPRNVRRFIDVGLDRVWPVSLSPARIVFGEAERVLGTKSGIYEPVKMAAEFSKNMAFNYTRTFHTMLQERGLGKIIEKGAGQVKRYSFKPGFSSQQADEAASLLIKADEIAQAARRDPKKLPQVMEQIERSFAGASPVASSIAKATWKFFDHLYAQHVLNKVPQIFRIGPLTPFGQAQVDRLVAQIRPYAERALGAAAGKNKKDLAVATNELLKQARKQLKDPTIQAWFDTSSRKLPGLLKTLDKELTFGSKGGRFVDYLENYTPRIRQRHNNRNFAFSSALGGRMHAFYTKRRRMVPFEGVRDLGTIIEGRIMAQAKELHLYPKLEEVVKFAKSLPRDLREYTDLWIARATGKPAAMDAKVAKLMERSVGHLADKSNRFLGTAFRTRWDDRRVQRLAMTVNNFTYMGGLGFKPYSAIRNLFQPLITVPADLGGLRDVVHLSRGYLRLLHPTTRRDTVDFIRRIGAIQEYAPEIYTKPAVFPFGARVAGKTLPTTEAVRDFAMWMFRGSDRMNRYVTGASAMSKWEGALARYGEKNITKFMSKAGVDGRHPWIKADIRAMLERGQYERAKQLFVKDVIADTQFLYGALESPIVMQKGGILSKTGLIFQSWWMNYGPLLEKWLRTGVSPGAKVERVITAAFSGAVAYNLLNLAFGPTRAQRTVATGPFPGALNEFMIPPSWTPIYYALKSMRNLPLIGMKVISPGGETEKDFNAMRGDIKKLLYSTSIFFPGGLQIKALAERVSEEGKEGLIPGILGLYSGPRGTGPGGIFPKGG